MSGGYFGTLRDPVAARLMAGKLVSEIGDFVGLAALVLLAYDATHSPVGPAVVLAARSLPALAVAGLLGGWLDRPQRRTALVALLLAGAAVVAVPAVAPRTATALVATALLGAIRPAFRSVEAALIAESVQATRRLPLFGLAATMNSISQAVGVLTGASIALTLNVRVALVADIGSFVLAAVILATLPVRPRTARAPRQPPTAGVRTVWAEPTMRRLGLLACACSASASLPQVLAPAIAPPGWVPAAMAAPAAGGLVFVLTVARGPLLRDVGNQVRVAVGTGAALLANGVAVALGAPAWVYVLGGAVVGAGLGWIVGAQATFTVLTPPGRMGQVEATMVASMIVSGGVGVLVLGGLAQLTAPAVAYLAGGATVLGAARGSAGVIAPARPGRPDRPPVRR